MTVNSGEEDLSLDAGLICGLSIMCPPDVELECGPDVVTTPDVTGEAVADGCCSIVFLGSVDTEILVVVEA